MLASLRAWRRARTHGLRIPFTRVLAISLRKGRPLPIVDAVITAHRAGVRYPIDNAETHALAGGNPNAVAAAAAILARRGQTPDLDHLSAIDLCRLDVRRLVEHGVDISRIPGGADPGPEYRLPAR